MIPAKRHKAVGKETGKTNHIERFNNTLRQIISCQVRKALSFFKKLNNHVGVFGTSFTTTMPLCLFRINFDHYYAGLPD